MTMNNQQPRGMYVMVYIVTFTSLWSLKTKYNKKIQFGKVKAFLHMTS